MTPITEGLIAGLLTEGLMALFAAARQGPASPIAPADLRALLQPPATVLARALSQGGAARSERVTRFLVSQEVETLLRKLFAGRLAEGDAASLATVEREFTALYGFIVGDEDAETDAPVIFRLLVDACDSALQLAIERGLPAALDARAVLRHRDLTARLAAIEQNIAFLRTEAPADPVTVESFVGDYLAQACGRFGYIIPQSFDRQRKLPIDVLLRTKDHLMRFACADPRLARISVGRLPCWSWRELIDKHGLITALSGVKPRFISFGFISFSQLVFYKLFRGRTGGFIDWAGICEKLTAMSLPWIPDCAGIDFDL